MKMSGIQILGESLEQASMYGIIRNFPKTADIKKEEGKITYTSTNIPEIEELNSSDTIEILFDSEGRMKYAFLKSGTILDTLNDLKVAISYICVGKNQFVPMRHPVSRNNSGKIVERTRDEVASKL